MLEPTQIHGSCHCGNIRFELSWPVAAAEIPVRECGCTFCQKHSGAWTSHRDSEVVLQIVDPSLLSKYKFGTHTADFYVCSVCGIVPIVVSEIDEQLYAVVNVNTFEANHDLAFAASKTNFDGEGTDDRLERRKRNWIPKVVLGATAS